jgi:adenine-specific DNA methylase
MVWDFGETNPLGWSSGSLPLSTNRYCKVIASPALNMPPSRVRTGDAAGLNVEDKSVDVLLTDPPYYDNVPYAALSDFFFVWFKRFVGDRFPELFSTPVTPKADEAVMEPQRHPGVEEARTFFEMRLGKAFKEIHSVLRPDGLAVIVYAHKTTIGWETMLEGILQAGFVVTSSWPLHTESETPTQGRPVCRAGFLHLHGLSKD